MCTALPMDLFSPQAMLLILSANIVLLDVLHLAFLYYSTHTFMCMSFAFIDSSVRFALILSTQFICLHSVWCAAAAQGHLLSNYYAMNAVHKLISYFFDCVSSRALNANHWYVVVNVLPLHECNIQLCVCVCTCVCVRVFVRCHPFDSSFVHFFYSFQHLRHTNLLVCKHAKKNKSEFLHFWYRRKGNLNLIGCSCSM